MQNSEKLHKIVSVADDNIEQAESFKRKLELNDETKAYGSFQELFEDPNVEIVYVGIVNFLHYKMVMSALDHGKHVLCEKPLGLNVKQVKEMIEKAKEKKRFLMEACFSRFFPVWAEVRKVMDQKTLGEVTAVHANLAHNDYITNPNRFRLKNGFTTLDTGATPLLDFGLYTIMLTLWIFYDEKPKKITAIGSKSDIGADVWSNITLEFSNGRKAFLCYSHADVFPNSAFISCTKGHMVMSESFWCPEKLQIIYGNPKYNIKKEFIEHPLKDDPAKYNFTNSAGLKYEADHVYDCIKNGLLESDNVTHEFSLTMAEILQEIRKQLEVSLPHDK
uniref:Trans-1,2-dihydrobenzene-1,2-diol dehydrogenase n=1 Tax=Acrobeloides nanus TaxID=290746 RepID=A0A914CC60_9BILA